MDCEVLTATRLERTKVSYVTRGVKDLAPLKLTTDRTPAAGDLVLARVAALGQHKVIEAPTGRRRDISVDDEVLVAYADRYAPDQFEACVPADLGTCHLAAGGGLAAQVVSRHGSVGEPTVLDPIGLLATMDGEVVNMRRLALSPAATLARRPVTVAVLGTSMNAGKTTTAAALVRGLTQAGLRVGAAKVTGTGAGRDCWQMVDAGAVRVLDFTDAGFASTCGLELADLAGIVHLLACHLVNDGAEVLVLEVADGLFQRETRMLVESPEFLASVDGVVFAAGEALGAVAGVHALREVGVPVLAVGGRVTASPLATREVAAALDVPVYPNPMLANADTVTRLLLHPSDPDDTAPLATASGVASVSTVSG